MGIELPAELQDVAARAGAKWPEADEDKMRESASAWRDAAKSIDTLAGAADGTAQGALGAFDGEAAQAARQDWGKFVADDGVLLSSAKQCHAAADRLEHAAEQVGAAKVQLVRELVALAKQTDAAEQAAASGQPQALAALDSAVSGAAANVAKVHSTLTSAVDQASGVVMEPGSSRGLLPAAGETAGGALNAGAGLASSTMESAASGAGGAVDGLGKAAGGTVGGVAENVGATAESVGRAAKETTGGVAEGVGAAADGVGHVARDATQGVGNTVDAVGGAAGQAGRTAPEEIGGVAANAQGAVGEAARTWEGSAEHTGPVKVEPGNAFAGTGPIPVTGGSARPGWTPDGGDPASSTAPHAVHSAWASPQAPQQPLPGGAAPPPAAAQPAPPAVGGHFVAQPGTASPQPAPPPAASARPPVQPPAVRGPAVFGSPAPQAPQQQQQQQQQPVQRAPLRPLPAPAQPPAAPAPDASQRPLRQGSRNADVVAFVLHQFPIGYMPVAASKASRQLPVSAEPVDRPGLSFPPQDHPQSHLISDRDALDRVRSAEVYAAARRELAERGEPEQLPAELTEGHEPLGEFGEAEWNQRFRGGEGERFVWPPAAEFPEGGVEPPEPVVLDPDTVLDSLGSGSGRLLFAAATTFAQRSLPAVYDERDYRRYRVMRPLPVWRSVAAPWFAQPGGGVRYRATYSLSDLIGLGYLVELTRAREVAEAATLRIERADGDKAGQDDPGESGGAASTERITRADVEAKAAEAGVSEVLRAGRDEATNHGEEAAK